MRHPRQLAELSPHIKRATRMPAVLTEIVEKMGGSYDADVVDTCVPLCMEKGFKPADAASAVEGSP